MFKHAQKRRSEDIEIQAAMHGIKMNLKGAAPGATHSDSDVLEYNGDPESVKHLSPEQRKAMTDSLLGKHTKAFKNGR
ncbi:MAG: hypothetical protein WA151_02235 [Desulfatirhabdiaceae bacterium]